METAAGLKGKALLLGVGNATDIPLATLAEQFDQLTLVEVDQESVVSAVQALPIKSQEKIMSFMSAGNEIFFFEVSSILHTIKKFIIDYKG